MKKVVLILLAAVAMAMAESYPYTHDGFFLNISLGFGGQGMGMTGSSMMDGYKITADCDAGGGVFELDYKIGGRILPYTILHATLLEVIALGGMDVESTYRGNYKKLEFGEVMYLYGIGVTYYIYPYNFFVSGSLGPVKFGLTQDDAELNSATEFGFGFQLAVGKEWWVSENWGLGASLSINYGSVDEDSEDLECSAFAITAKFSATFN